MNSLDIFYFWSIKESTKLNKTLLFISVHSIKRILILQLIFLKLARTLCVSSRFYSINFDG